MVSSCVCISASVIAFCHRVVGLLRYSVVRLSLCDQPAVVYVLRRLLCVSVARSPRRCGVDPSAWGGLAWRGGGRAGRARDLRRLSGKDGPASAALALHLWRRDRASQSSSVYLSSMYPQKKKYQNHEAYICCKIISVYFDDSRRRHAR